MALLTRADRDLIITAADRLSEFCTQTEPGYYDYGTQSLIRDLKELADRP